MFVRFFPRDPRFKGGDYGFPRRITNAVAYSTGQEQTGITVEQFRDAAGAAAGDANALGGLAATFPLVEAFSGFATGDSIAQAFSGQIIAAAGSAIGDAIVDGNSSRFSVTFDQTVAGVDHYICRSDLNGGFANSTLLRVLVPTAPDSGQPHRFVYVFPVSLDLVTFGDGLDEAKRLNFHNNYNATVIAPAFLNEPWIGDNPNDLAFNYMSFFFSHLKPLFVIPSLTITGLEEHWGISFSKGGFSMISILLKNPPFFERSAGYDIVGAAAHTGDFNFAATNGVPSLDRPDWTGAANVYVSQAVVDTFDPFNLAAGVASSFTGSNRLWLSGGLAYNGATADLDTLFTGLGMLHTYEDRSAQTTDTSGNTLGTIGGSALIPGAHTWVSGWLPHAFDKLAAGKAVADGNDSFTKLLMHMDGVDASTIFLNFAAAGDSILTFKNPVATGTAQLDTAQKKFGLSSLLIDGTANAMVTHNPVKFWGGVGVDVVVDCWVRFSSLAGLQFIWQKGAGAAAIVYMTGSTIIYFTGSDQITSGAISANTWIHVALVQDASDGHVKLFLDGVSQGASTSLIVDAIQDNNFVNLGNRQEGDFPMNGWIDEFRLSIGTDRGWFGGFTPPTQAYG